MARTWFRGWETGEARSESSSDNVNSSGAFTGAAMSFEGTIVRTGSFSLKAQAVSGASSTHQAIGGIGSYCRVYVRVTARPSSTARVIVGSTTGGLLNIRLNPNGTLAYYTGTTLIGTSTTALTDTSKWYMVEWRAATSVAGQELLRIDGTAEVTGNTTASISSALGPNDTVADTYTVYFDDLAQDDADWPGEGAVVLLMPISDNGSSAASWTKPGGSTTNRYTSVDNTPPVGVADSTSAANAERQIRNASALTSYVADMTDYATAGIGPGDTVNAVQAFVLHGAPVSTGAKVGSLQITSNPAEASATAFGSTSSFYWQGNAAGTYPAGWFRSRGGIVSSPSVTVATNPTLSLNITGGTASRIADCCFMGIYVDYTPATAANVTVTPGAASLTLTASAPAIVRPIAVAPSAASLSTTASAPAVVRATVVTPGAGSLSVTLSAPTVTATANQAVSPGAASLTATVSAPTVSVSDFKLVLPAAASLAVSVSATAVTVTLNRFVVPTVASLAVTASTPAVVATANRFVTPSASTLTTTASAPTVAATANRFVVPTEASLVTTASAPTLVVSDHKASLPTAASLSLSASAPSVTATANQTVLPSAASASLMASVPTVTATDHKTVALSPASLFTTFSAPAVGVSDNIVVSPAWTVLSLTAAVPNVFATAPRLAVPGAASLTMIGAEPFVSAGRSAQPGAATLMLTASAPDLSLTAHQRIAPDSAALMLAAFAPYVFTPLAVEVGAASLTLTGVAPIIPIPGQAESVPGTAILLLTTIHPMIRIAFRGMVVGIAPDVVVGGIATQSAPHAAISATAVHGVVISTPTIRATIR